MVCAIVMIELTGKPCSICQFSTFSPGRAADRKSFICPEVAMAVSEHRMKMKMRISTEFVPGETVVAMPVSKNMK